MTRAWLLLCVLLVTGCGSSATFSHRTSAGCMTLHGGRVGVDDVDTIARQRGAGAFRVRVGTDGATVAFGRTTDEAKRIEAAYAQALDAAGEPTKYLLSRNRNAVVVWSHMPGDEHRNTVEDCLASS